MTNFSSWCAPAVVVKINGHHAAVLVSTDDGAGIEAVAATLPKKYAKTETLALIAEKYGKPKVSDFLRNKLPVRQAVVCADGSPAPRTLDAGGIG